jgi:endoglucanase
MVQAAKFTICVAFFILALLPFAQSQAPVGTAQSGTTQSVSLTGVNIAGGDFGDRVPGIYGQDYIYPARPTIDYYAAKGMNIFRLPVLWERLQHDLDKDLDETEMKRIDAVVSYVTSKGIKVIIDVHNYAKYSGAVIGSPGLPPSALGELWRQIALQYKQNDLVVFGLMNEPTGLPTETWLQAANDAIAKIRQVGARNLILVPGNGWSSARDWMSRKYGTPNSEAMLNIVDPADNYVFDVHQYFDFDFTGTHDDCQSAEIGIRSLAPFTQWARDNRKRGFLGEFGAGANATCLENLDRVLQFLAANNDVWLGWTFWAAGTWWPKDYYTNVEPIDGKDRPQMLVLEKYLNKAPAPEASPKKTE